MVSTFGSTQKEELPDAGMVIAKKVRDTTATLVGVSVELQIQKQQIKHLNDQVATLVNLYETVIGMYDTLQRQRAVELNARVGHGPTA